MLENIVYDHPSKTFIGVRFVLFGFDSVKKEKVRSKLLEGGGVDAGRYGPDCTHVIVDQLVYDDPICVAARNEGKVAVTSLWVDHSCDVGMPVDTASIMYRPLRDLNRIPGAKSLIVCLTGYQRQDRDDIMTMVGLMGANFLKPLVANKVTHLVCYKFEGEKYELAKKLKKIKLVNHRWLEDCLRAWEILPESDYNKSGYELEIMETEAKDSDEEINKVATEQYGESRVVVSPQNSRIEMRSPHKSFLFEQEILRKNINSGPCKLLSEPENTKEVLSAAEKDTKSDPASWPQEILNETLDIPGSRDARTLCEASDLASNPSDNALSPSKSGRNFASGSITAKIFPHSDLSKQSDLSYSRRSGTKASLPMSSGQKESYIESPAANRAKLKVSDRFSISPSSLVQNETTSSSAKTPVTHLLHPEEGQSSTLHEKRKMAIPGDSPKLQIMSYSEEMISGDVFSANKMQGLVPSSGKHGLHEMISHLSPRQGASSMDKNEIEGPAQSSDNISKNVPPETRKESNVQALQTSSKELKHACLASKVDDMEPHEHGDSEGVVPQNEFQDVKVSSSGTKMTGIQNSCGLADLGSPKEGSANSQQKPLKRKMLARKVLGSSSRFNKGSLTNKKGSIDPNKSNFSNDSAINKVGRSDAEEHGKLVNSERVKSLHPTGSADKDNTTDRSNSVESQHGVSKMARFMNDETEASEDGEEDFHVAVHIKQPDGVGALHSVDVPPTKEISASAGANQNHNHILVEDQLMMSYTEKNKSKAEKAVSGNKPKLNLSTSLDEREAERLIKSKKRPLSKTKKNNLSNVIKVGSYGEDALRKESKSEENNVKIDSKKERISSKTAPNSKMSAPLKKFKNSLEVEKENRPVGFGDRNASNDEEINEQVTSKSKEKPLMTDVKDTKANSGLVPVDPIPKCRNEPACFILSGHKLQRKEFQQVIRRLKGRVCRDSHQWSYQATHLIIPDPIRRTEKLFAAAASGRWILKTDYITASNEAGKFLAEQPYEWHKNGLSQDGAINLEAPRKWRFLRERTGHGAFYGMRIIVYGECIAPPLDTLKRAVKAGDGTILATSPPYTRLLQSGIDFAIVSPGMPRVDMWVQEFLRHEIPCVSADYLVEYVCKPGYSLDRHVQYGTHAWAEKSVKNLMNRMEAIIEDLSPPREYSSSDIPCQICGSRDRGEVMLICGDESGSSGCGIGTHIDCCDPPLEEVPDEDWFCPKCRNIEDQTNDQPISKKSKPKSRRK